MNKITKAFALKSFKAGRMVYMSGKHGQVGHHISHVPAGQTAEQFFAEKAKVAAGPLNSRVVFYT